jgi:hypothetical protein
MGLRLIQRRDGRLSKNSKEPVNGDQRRVHGSAGFLGEVVRVEEGLAVVEAAPGQFLEKICR